jgi:hypothetical protein
LKTTTKVNLLLLQPKFWFLIQQKYDEVLLKDKTISKHVMTMLTAKIISDVNILSVKGIYNSNSYCFGASMDGLNPHCFVSQHR